MSGVSCRLVETTEICAVDVLGPSAAAITEKVELVKNEEIKNQGLQKATHTIMNRFRFRTTASLMHSSRHYCTAINSQTDGI